MHAVTRKRRYVNLLCFCQTPNSMCPVAIRKLFRVHHMFCPTDCCCFFSTEQHCVYHKTYVTYYTLIIVVIAALLRN